MSNETPWSMWPECNCDRCNAARAHNAEIAQTVGAPHPAYWPASKITEKVVLPADAAKRKAMPITTGLLHYFPRAAAYVSSISKVNNDKHNPGEAMRWSKEKSSDHLDCCARHLVDAGKRDDVGTRESGYLAWRALANLEIELEAAEARGEVW